MPIDGVVVPLESVSDPVFAGRILGDAVAIEPLGSRVIAPFDGEIVAVAPTGHSVTLRSGDSLELLIHIGIDTVNLGGEGFTVHVGAGQRVEQGAALIDLDLDAIVAGGAALTTCLVVLNENASVLPVAEGPVRAGDRGFDVELAETGQQAAPTDTSSNAFWIGKITLEHGVHARPAAAIADIAKRTTASLQLKVGDRVADAASPSALLALAADHGDTIEISGSGADARTAVAALAKLIGTEQEPHTPIQANPCPSSLALREGELGGIRAAPGIAIGHVHRIADADIELTASATDPMAEQQNLDAALASLRNRLVHLASGDPGGVADAHIALLQDSELLEGSRNRIAQGTSAPAAWRAVSRALEERLLSGGKARIAERAADLRDIERQLVGILVGNASDDRNIPSGSIIVAHEIMPSMLLGSAGANIAAIATAAGGPTSHAAIIAASRGIPMVVGLGDALLSVENDAKLIVDGDRGAVNAAPDTAALDRALSDAALREQSRVKAQADASVDCRLADGTRIEIFANLGSASDAANAVASGAEGCGLLRTEFLFAERPDAPSEEEQVEAYRAIADTLGKRRLIMRTLDAGADKPLGFLPMPHEENPALGQRGIRLSLAHPELLKTQLRAMLRAVPSPQLWIMLPMVIDGAEIHNARNILDEAKRDLGITETVPLGVMIETPAAALIAGTLAQDADFFSVGSNDLTQYALAIDRGHPALARQADALHPAVLKLIAQAARDAQSHDRWFGLCGGLASDPDAAPLLVGLGCIELSATVAAIPLIKQQLRKFSMVQCRALAEQALICPDADSVRALLLEQVQ